MSSFHHLINALISLLRRNYKGHSFANYLGDELEFWAGDATVDYVKGFVRCASRLMHFEREDDELLDNAFNAVLDFQS